MALSGCGCDGIASVEIERTASAIIYEVEPAGALDLEEFENMDLQLGEFENTEDVRGKHIADARLDRLVITVIDPLHGDLSFADRVEVFVESPDEPARRIAYREDFPAGESTIEFEIDGVDLEPYIVADSLTFTARIEGDPPPQETEIEGTATLDVGVTLAGACNHM